MTALLIISGLVILELIGVAWVSWKTRDGDWLV